MLMVPILPFTFCQTSIGGLCEREGESPFFMDYHLIELIAHMSLGEEHSNTPHTDMFEFASTGSPHTGESHDNYPM